MPSKKRIENQKYEEYWKLTLEYSNYEEKNFNECLRIIVDYIDLHEGKPIEYNLLQECVARFRKKKDGASVRKSINQFLKLGFINNGFRGYHCRTKDFLDEKNLAIKKILYSEILYDNASFSRSATHPSNKKELNFLIKTIEHCGKIDQENLIAIMFEDIDQYERGYLLPNELKRITQRAKENMVIKRKYNQLTYLWRICKHVLAGIYFDKQTNTLNLVGSENNDGNKFDYTKGRDTYRQTLYKNLLYEESRQINGDVLCYVENLKFPVLIASHIKPYIQCDESEKFDGSNGILLSRTMDQLFDQGWITFDDDGTIIVNPNLQDDLKKYLANKNLNKKYLADSRRLYYLKYHRNNVFNPQKQYKF